VCGVRVFVWCVYVVWCGLCVMWYVCVCGVRVCVCVCVCVVCSVICVFIVQEREKIRFFLVSNKKQAIPVENYK
jgi:hypothetical protein